MSKPLLLSMWNSSAVCSSREDFTQHSVCVSKGFYLFNHVTKTDSLPLCPLNITNGCVLPLLYCVASIQHVLASPNPWLPDENLPPILRHLQHKHSLLGVCANHTQPNLITAYSVANCSWCREAVISLRHLLEKKMKNSLFFSLLSARTISMDSFVPSESILLRRTFNKIPGNMIKPHAWEAPI